ncbi:MAG: peptidase C25 [Thermoplasmatales archaeon]|nr:MAG: peptidase C25 [Thermoplasmatales archaeon]
MKKTFPLLVVGILVLSGLGAVALPEIEQGTLEKIESISFSDPKLKELDDYVEVKLNEATSYLMEPGNYILPTVTRVFVFPFRTKIKNVDVDFSDIKEKILSKNICLATEPIPDIYNKKMPSKIIEENKDIISHSGLYPEKQYNYNIGAGRDDDKIVNYLSVKLCPIQYRSSEKKLYYANNAHIKITYELSSDPLVLTDEYEMVVIAPSKFTQSLQPLIDHKNEHNVTTKLVTLDDIYNSVYFPVEGRDCAEEVKYFIKSSLDEWGIKYVLLVGGRKGGIFEEKWWVPVRYSHLVKGDESSYLCDLYFADIYDDEGNFSSWDTNSNNIFAEWDGVIKDILDMYPEVYVGRLACKNIFEVKTMVNKIITYENTAYGEEWFTKFVGVAGDTYPDVGDPYYEGELATEAAFNYLDGFESSFLWTSNGKFSGKQSVIDEISKGCGFVHFSGHGNPALWSNHPPNSEDEWVEGPSCFDMRKLRNGDKQPIVLVGGCHNAQINTSLFNIIKGILENGLKGYFNTDREWGPLGEFWYEEWVPRCWAWSMASRSRGGCIGIMANTGLGYGIAGENWNTGRGRFLEIQFFRSYSEGKDILGETHSTELIYYLNEFPPMYDLTDCKIVQQWILLGDPSLKIGGYPS